MKPFVYKNTRSFKDINNAEHDILQHLTSYFDCKFQEHNKNFEQRLNIGSKKVQKKVSKIEFKLPEDKIQHERNTDLIENVETIEQLAQDGSITRSLKKDSLSHRRNKKAK